MTEVEKKALALVNEHSDYEVPDLDEAQYSTAIQALISAVEQYEAFRQEVSEAVEYCVGQGMSGHHRATLDRFIIAKPDPISSGLAVAVEEALELVIGDADAAKLREALGRRGLQVTEIER